MSPLLSLAFLGMPSGVEWVVILIVALLLFGRRLPEVMRGLGGGVREFRKGIEGGEDLSREDTKSANSGVERIESKPAEGSADAPAPGGERR